MSSKEAILARIRNAVAESPQPAPVERSYLAPATDDQDRRVEQFVEMLNDYQAKVRRVSEQQVAEQIARACGERGAKRLLAAPGLPSHWLPDELDLLEDDGTTASLASADGVITTCALAIAETGTLVLDAGAGQGRRALTLIPDYHLCIVEAARVVASVPEAVGALHEAVTRGRPLTFISGPSATSDIELMRVEGVHGPRNLEVLVVE